MIDWDNIKKRSPKAQRYYLENGPYDLYEFFDKQEIYIGMVAGVKLEEYDFYGNIVHKGNVLRERYEGLIKQRELVEERLFMLAFRILEEEL